MGSMMGAEPKRDRKAERLQEKQKKAEELRLAEEESEIKKRTGLGDYAGRSLLQKTNQASQKSSGRSTSYGGARA